jgi:hypothetical protein
MERREESIGTRDLASAPESVRRDDETAQETVRRDDETVGREDGTAQETVRRDDNTAPETVGRDDGTAQQIVARDDETSDADRDERTDAGDGGTRTAEDPESTQLLATNESGDFGRRWEEIQTAFVDEPRRAVEEADELVASVMQRLADGFARERERLEGQWSRGEDVSTEDLRVTLQRYRSFFRRLLSA